MRKRDFLILGLALLLAVVGTIWFLKGQALPTEGQMECWGRSREATFESDLNKVTFPAC